MLQSSKTLKGAKVISVPTAKYRLYFGSGTKENGGHTRIRTYIRQSEYDLVNLPRYVQQSLTQGYKIDKIAIVLRCAIPEIAMRLHSRALFLTLEALFAFSFNAMYTVRNADFGVQGVALWDRAELEYEGLCSHSPLREVTKDILSAPLDRAILEGLLATRREKRNAIRRIANLSPEQIETQRKRSRVENKSAEQIERRRELSRFENLSVEKREKLRTRARNRGRNLSGNQIERRKATARNWYKNLPEDRREKLLARKRVEHMSEEKRERARANARVENMSEEKREKARACKRVGNISEEQRKKAQCEGAC